MDEYYNKHYIRPDESNNIVKGFSDAFEQPQEGDVCLNEQGGYQFRLSHGGEENPALFDEYARPLYQWKCGEVAEANLPEFMPPTPMPTLEEQVRALSAAISEMAGEIYG